MCRKFVSAKFADRSGRCKCSIRRRANNPSRQARKGALGQMSFDAAARGNSRCRAQYPPAASPGAAEINLAACSAVELHQTISNRHATRSKILVTATKQRATTFSNRHKMALHTPRLSRHKRRKTRLNRAGNGGYLQLFDIPLTPQWQQKSTGLLGYRPKQLKDRREPSRGKKPEFNRSCGGANRHAGLQSHAPPHLARRAERIGRSHEGSNS